MVISSEAVSLQNTVDESKEMHYLSIGKASTLEARMLALNFSVFYGLNSEIMNKPDWHVRAKEAFDMLIAELDSLK